MSEATSTKLVRLACTPVTERDDASAASFGSPPKADRKAALLDRAPFLVACAMLALLVAVYGALRPGVFSLDELNTDTAAALTLLLAATGQTIVLLRGGIDLSIGGVISLGTVLAATHFGDQHDQRRALGLAHRRHRCADGRHQRPADHGPAAAAIPGHAWRPGPSCRASR